MTTDLLRIINKYGLLILALLMAFFIYRWGVSVGSNKTAAYTVKINKKRVKTLKDSIEYFKKENSELLKELEIYNLDADEKTKRINIELNELIKNVNGINLSTDELKKFIAKYERLNKSI